MKKAELIKILMENIRGKNYSDTDIGVMLCEVLNNEFLSHKLTIAKR